jgi:hypothetical protein
MNHQCRLFSVGQRRASKFLYPVNVIEFADVATIAIKA